MGVLWFRIWHSVNIRVCHGESAKVRVRVRVRVARTVKSNLVKTSHNHQIGQD